MCHGIRCDLPLCTYRREPAFGRRRLHRSVKGRTKREAAYMASHQVCEVCLIAPSTECHHIGGRGLGGHRRDTADLRAECLGCHQGKHAVGRKD